MTKIIFGVPVKCPNWQKISVCFLILALVNLLITVLTVIPSGLILNSFNLSLSHQLQSFQPLILCPRLRSDLGSRFGLLQLVSIFIDIVLLFCIFFMNVCVFVLLLLILLLILLLPLLLLFGPLYEFLGIPMNSYEVLRSIIPTNFNKSSSCEFL